MNTKSLKLSCLFASVIALIQTPSGLAAAPRVGTTSSGVTYCADWNGFLGGMWNFAEHVNYSTNNLRIRTTLYNPNGEAQGTTSHTILPGSETDVSVHSLNGFELNKVGQVCTNAASAETGDLEARLMQYKTASDGRVEFALPSPLSAGIAGSQHVLFNTFQPSQHPDESTNFVANWVSLRNMEDNVQIGTFVVYNVNGQELLRRSNLSIPAKGLMNFGLHELGSNNFGVASWTPEDEAARFQLNGSRYYYDQPEVVDNFEGATRIEGRSPMDGTVVVPIDTTDGRSIVEIANVSSSAATITVAIHRRGGTLVRTLQQTVASHSSWHIIADSIIRDSTGSALITSSVDNSIVAAGVTYLHNDQFRLESTYAVAGENASGSVLRGTYNTFLNQRCFLYLSNVAAEDVSVEMTMTRSDGTVAASDTIALSAHGTRKYDLCANEEPNHYGVVKLTVSANNSIVASVLRVGASSSYHCALPVKSNGGESSARVESLAQLPSFASLIRENEQARLRNVSISAVSGTPPSLGEIPNADVENLFWRNGVLAAILDGDPSETQCGEFWQGASDGQSGGAAACYMTQDVGGSLEPIVQGGVSMCYMQNGPVQSHLDAGAVSLISGVLPEGGINNIFATPTGSTSRIVRVQVAGGEERGGVNASSDDGTFLFARVYSEGENAESGHSYRTQLWFCSADSGPADESQLYEITEDGTYRVESLQNDDHKAIFTASAQLIESEDGSISFDPTADRVVNIDHQMGDSSGFFKAAITVTGENLIYLRKHEIYHMPEEQGGDQERMAYSISRFSGSGAASARFLEGAFKSNDVHGDHENISLNGTEFRGSRYLAAPGNFLVDQLDGVSFDSAFYQEELGVDLDLSNYDCGTTPDVVIGMNMSHPLLLAVAEECEGDRISNMSFCNSDEMQQAQNDWFGVCGFDE